MLVIGLLMAATAVGCGGGDDDDERAPARERQASPADGPVSEAPGEDADPGSPPVDDADRGGERPREGAEEPAPSEARPGREDERDARAEGERRRRVAPERSLTHAQTVAAGDRLCAAFRRELAATDDEGSDDFERLARRTARLRELTGRTVERFRALSPPRERRDTLRAYVDAIEAQLPILAELQAAAERRDRRAASDATRKIKVLGAAAKGFAGRYGFRVCGSG